ncbi:hypothetical protein [Sulfuricurvum sp.]|uniref:hypothetical protein n=1 Tax=Sulfuricurvum sp. TaxID=2025608 RepID=UPI003BB5578D
MERARLPATDGGEDFLIYRTLLMALLFIGCSTPLDTLPYPLTLSEKGLGAIHPNTPFDKIPSIMIGFKCEKLNIVSSNTTEIIYLIQKGSQPIAQIVSNPSGNKITQIHVLSPQIKDSYNQSIGDLLSYQGALCKKNSCHYPAAPSVIYKIDPKTQTIREITFQKL